MPNKQSAHGFAELISISSVALLCGVGAVSVLSQNLIIASFLGTIGIKLGATTWKIEGEKLDKIIAAIGITLSIVPLIYALIVFI